MADLFKEIIKLPYEKIFIIAGIILIFLSIMKKFIWKKDTQIEVSFFGRLKALFFGVAFILIGLSISVMNYLSDNGYTPVYITTPLPAQTTPGTETTATNPDVKKLIENINSKLREASYEEGGSETLTFNINGQPVFYDYLFDCKTDKDICYSILKDNTSSTIVQEFYYDSIKDEWYIKNANENKWLKGPSTDNSTKNDFLTLSTKEYNALSVEDDPNLSEITIKGNTAIDLVVKNFLSEVKINEYSISDAHTEITINKKESYPKSIYTRCTGTANIEGTAFPFNFEYSEDVYNLGTHFGLKLPNAGDVTNYNGLQ